MALAEKISASIEHISLLEKLYKENLGFHNDQSDTEELNRLTPHAQDLFFEIERISLFNLPLLIAGEIGTEKSLIAKTLHNKSFGVSQPYIHLATAPSQSLNETELFALEKAALLESVTANKDKYDFFGGGTIFLEEISDLDLVTQQKLVQLLEQQKVAQNGDRGRKQSYIRVIAASSKDLSNVVDAGTFRSDLYFNLNPIKIEVPPLRLRKPEIPLIVKFCLERFSEQALMKPKKISQGALDLLMTYDWPGNVSELINVIKRAVTFGKRDSLSLRDFPEFNWKKKRFTTLKEMERQQIIAAIKETGGNKAKAASLLGISRATIHAKLKDY